MFGSNLILGYAHTGGKYGTRDNYTASISGFQKHFDS